MRRMKITDEQLQEFIAIYEDEFGVKLTQQEATEEANHVLNLLRALSNLPCREDDHMAG